jgi:hypothetical protein
MTEPRTYPLFLAQADVVTWLEESGFDANTVADVTINFRRSDPHLSGPVFYPTLTVELFTRDEAGEPRVTADGNDFVREVHNVSLKSFPRLTANN